MAPGEAAWIGARDPRGRSRHFKQINDTHGHPVGDMVLQELAEIMKTTARETDAVSRVGGDEFVIVLPDTAWQGAMAFAERLRRNVDEHTFGGDELLEITISVGVAHARGTDALTAEDLLEQADRNLYKPRTADATASAPDRPTTPVP